MNEADLRSYKENFEKETGCCPQTLRLEHNSQDYHNASDTSNRQARGGVSWIDYWRAHAKRYGWYLSCASCGKRIYRDTRSLQAISDYQANYKSGQGGTINDCEAQGAHIQLAAEVPPRNYWIVPLCPGCNNPHREELDLSAGTILCEEVGAEIINEE